MVGRRIAFLCLGALGVTVQRRCPGTAIEKFRAYTVGGGRRREEGITVTAAWVKAPTYCHGSGRVAAKLSSAGLESGVTDMSLIF
jgi:hypothetical protein